MNASKNFIIDTGVKPPLLSEHANLNNEIFLWCLINLVFTLLFTIFEI